MKIKGVDVSGIKRVVISRSLVWEYEVLWILRNPIPRAKSQGDMTKYIQSLISNEKNRIWIHGDTLNIVKKEVKL